MSLHPDFPTSPYAPLIPEQRWFPADETLRMFDEDWPRYVLKMATGAGKTRVLSLLIAWSFFHKLYEADSALSRNSHSRAEFP